MADIDTTNTKEAAGPSIQLSPEKEAEYERITRNLAELTSGEIIRKVLSEGKTVKCYWGMSISASGLAQRNVGEMLTRRRKCYDRKT